MEKINNILIQDIRLVCWDLDGTLFDTETMWFNMDKLVEQEYGSNLSKDEHNKASEKIAANAYKTWGYRGNADKALQSLKDNNIHQVVINKCDLTNETMFKNEAVNGSFSFNSFDEIISEKLFEDEFSLNDMYKYALAKYKIENAKQAVAICDMPFELKAAKKCGLITIWAKNSNYPFNEVELKEINEFADFYVEDFLDLVK